VIEKSHYQAPNKLIELEKIAVHITGRKWIKAPMTKLPTKELELLISFTTMLVHSTKSQTHSTIHLAPHAELTTT